MKIVHVPVDKFTRKANVNAMRRAITRNTVMIVGSAPSYPHGAVDDIESLAKLAKKYKLPLHVDCCLGSFIVPFMNTAGFPFPKFDFSIDGVTSISCDTHKYGYAPKGSSVIMYSHPDYRKGQYFVTANWPGGIYASPSIAGSRPGGLVAATWAALMAMGEEGYVNATRKVITTTRYIIEGLKPIKGISILGEPIVSVVALGSEVFDIYRLSSALSARGWNINNLQFPPAIHFCFTLVHTMEHEGNMQYVADQFLNDVRTEVGLIMKDPKQKTTGSAAIYGLAQKVPDRGAIADIVQGYLDITLALHEPQPDQLQH